MKRNRRWDRIVETVDIRQRAAAIALGMIRRLVLQSVDTSKASLRAEFTLEEIDAGLRSNEKMAFSAGQ